jgi:hypothetical protein
MNADKKEPGSSGFAGGGALVWRLARCTLEISPPDA